MLFLACPFFCPQIQPYNHEVGKLIDLMNKYSFGLNNKFYCDKSQKLQKAGMRGPLMCEEIKVPGGKNLSEWTTTILCHIKLNCQ